MKNVSVALAEHLAGPVTTLATCWEIVRRDGLAFAFTDHDRDIAFDGRVYLARFGYARTAVVSDDRLSVDNLDVDGTGELALLLRDAAVTPDWIDGFLMSITLAPKLIQPNRWLPEILGSAIGTLPPDKIQRFADLILMRANGCVAQAEDPEAFLAAMTQRSTIEMRDWATGFSYACDQFRSSWPAKSTAADDRAIQARVSDAMASGFSEPEAKTLSVWVAARHARNIGV